jgi:phosphoserine phosphatase
MYTVSIFANPEIPFLSPEIVQPVFDNWKPISQIRWLMIGVACEFDVLNYPRDFEFYWNEFQKLSVDLVIQPTIGRQKKVLIADMDSTIIQQECIDELASEFGVGEQVSVITRKSMNGELNFENALRARVHLLKGAPFSLIEKVLKNKISLVPGVRRLLATMKHNGAYCALVSGGFTVFSEAIQVDLGFDESRANVLIVENGFLTGYVQEPILGRNSKVVALNQITHRLGVSAKDVIAVGDGANDLGMLAVAGFGLALHAKPSVQKEVKNRVNFGDLTSLLFLQGYSSKNFITV